MKTKHHIQIGILLTVLVFLPYLQTSDIDSQMVVKTPKYSHITSSPIYIYSKGTLMDYGSGTGNVTDPFVLYPQVINASTGHGIEISGVADMYIVIENMTIYDGSDDFDGIQITNTPNIIIRNNNLTNNKYGVLILASPNATISNNTLQQNSASILVSVSHNSTVNDNYITNSLYTGITLLQSERCSIIKNEIGFVGNGIRLDRSPQNILIRNIIYNGSQSGIFLENPTTNKSMDNEIFENVITNNSHYGIYIAHWALENKIWANSIFGNVLGQALNVSDTIGNNTWFNHGLGNYWGDYSTKYSATSSNGLIWDTPYVIDGSIATDAYPLVNEVIEDLDGDNLSNLDEIFLYNTFPASSDSDSDQLPDGDEVLIYLTNPLNSDSDGDSYSDYDEINADTDPNDPNNFPNMNTGGGEEPGENPDDNSEGNDNNRTIPAFTLPILMTLSASFILGIAIKVRKNKKILKIPTGS